MRDSRLDVVARQIAASGSRRSLIHRLGAAALASLPGIVSPAGGADAAGARCQKLAKPCSKRKKCCAGLQCRSGRCQCPAGKRACAGGCIGRDACCPKTEIACNGECLPKGSPCCGSGKKACRQQCIPEKDCCDASDCIGECLTGECQNLRCVKRDVGTPCAEPGQLCNSQGACNVACGDDGSCPALPERTPAEFCRRLVCVDDVCEETHKEIFTILPAEFQQPHDCIVWECNYEMTLTNGVGMSNQFSTGDLPRPDPNPCKEAVCRFPGDPHVIDRPAGSDCPGGTCDGNGTCVPGP